MRTGGLGAYPQPTRPAPNSIPLTLSAILSPSFKYIFLPPRGPGHQGCVRLRRSSEASVIKRRMGQCGVSVAGDDAL